MITNIILSLFVFALLFALIETSRKLAITESRNRNLARLNTRYGNYAVKMESLVGYYKTLAEYYQQRSAQLQNSLVEYTVERVGDQYTLPVLPKDSGKTQIIGYCADIAKKQSGKEAQQTATDSQIKATIAIDLASLGTISSKEQTLIDKWRKSGTNDNECAKRIANIRASATKQTTKA